MLGIHSILGSSSASPPRAGSGGIRRLRHYAADIEAVFILMMGWYGQFWVSNQQEIAVCNGQPNVSVVEGWARCEARASHAGRCSASRCPGRLPLGTGVERKLFAGNQLCQRSPKPIDLKQRTSQFVLRHCIHQSSGDRKHTCSVSRAARQA